MSIVSTYVRGETLALREAPRRPRRRDVPRRAHERRRSFRTPPLHARHWLPAPRPRVRRGRRSRSIGRAARPRADRRGGKRRPRCERDRDRRRDAPARRRDDVRVLESAARHGPRDLPAVLARARTVRSRAECPVCAATSRTTRWSRTTGAASRMTASRRRGSTIWTAMRTSATSVELAKTRADEPNFMISGRLPFVVCVPVR